MMASRSSGPGVKTGSRTNFRREPSRPTFAGRDAQANRNEVTFGRQAGLRLQAFASFQLSPTPTSTVSGTLSDTAFSIPSRTTAVA